MPYVDEQVYALLEKAYGAFKEADIPRHKQARKELRQFLKKTHVTRNGRVLIGYWFKYKMPVEDSNDLTEKQMEAFWPKYFRALEHGRTINYKGSSHCRLCGQSNGSTEVELSLKGIKLAIPHGYTHYIKEHDVKPDSLLLELLGIKTK